MEEIWRRVPSSDFLWASSLGRVKGDPKIIPLPNGGYKTNILNPTYGYWSKTKNKNYGRLIFRCRGRTYKVATLVCEAFHGPRPDGYVVSHKDEDSRNNRQDNLEYTTQQINMNMPKVKAYHQQVCRLKIAA